MNREVLYRRRDTAEGDTGEGGGGGFSGLIHFQDK